MLAGLWNGLSGLSVAGSAIDSTSNNISNVNTVGFKEDSLSFADLIYQNGEGKGVSVVDGWKSVEQGSFTETDSSYDFAIDGSGYFVVEDSITEGIEYTRDGTFKMGSDGYLVTTDEEYYVHGIQTSPATAVSTDPANTIFTDDFSEYLGSQTIQNENEITTINAKATNYSETAVDTGTSGDNFKEASTVISDIELLKTNYQNSLTLYNSTQTDESIEPVSQQSEVDFSALLDQLNSDTDYIEISIDGTTVRQDFDTDAQTTLNKFSDKISAINGMTSSVDENGLLTISSLVPGESFDITETRLNDSGLNDTTVTEAVSGSGFAMVEASRDALKSAVEDAGGEFLELTNSIDLTNQESLTTTEIQLKLDNLDFSDNGFADVEVENGTIYMTQGDTKFVVGQLSTVTFTSIYDLEPQGGNNYIATASSGEPIYANSLNTIYNETLELSNGNLSDGLTDLMIYQKAFEANSKSITTCDEFLQTVIELRS